VAVFRVPSRRATWQMIGAAANTWHRTPLPATMAHAK
jgi:hypothetical protein